MIFLIILLALILLIFFIPYGVDAGYENSLFTFAVQAGPVCIRLFPRKPKTEKQKERARRRKEKKEAKKKAREESAAQEVKTDQGKDETIKVKAKKPLDFDFILALLEMGVHAVRRFFRSFSVDYFKLHYTVAGRDPYTTAMRYGKLCTAAEGILALAEEKITLKKRDIYIGADFTQESGEFAFHITLTMQLYKLVHLAFAFGVEFIRYKIKSRRDKTAAVSERKEDNRRQSDQ